MCLPMSINDLSVFFDRKVDPSSGLQVLVSFSISFSRLWTIYCDAFDKDSVFEFCNED